MSGVNTTATPILQKHTPFSHSQRPLHQHLNETLKELAQTHAYKRLCVKGPCHGRRLRKLSASRHCCLLSLAGQLDEPGLSPRKGPPCLRTRQARAGRGRAELHSFAWAAQLVHLKCPSLQKQQPGCSSDSPQQPPRNGPGMALEQGPLAHKEGA
jgi:hypothetical protein